MVQFNKECCKRSDKCLYRWTACCWSWRAQVTWFPLLIALFTGIGLLIYIFIYIPNLYFNDNSVKTECLILKYNLTAFGDADYNSNCNCVEDCSSGTCEQNCGSCNTYEYVGWILLNYLTNYSQYIIVVEPYNNQLTDYGYDTVDTYLNREYPINTTITCYYLKNDPNVLQLLPNSTISPFIASMIFFSFSGIIIIIWIILIATRCARKLRVKISKDKRSQFVHHPFH